MTSTMKTSTKLWDIQDHRLAANFGIPFPVFQELFKVQNSVWETVNRPRQICLRFQMNPQENMWDSQQPSQGSMDFDVTYWYKQDQTYTQRSPGGTGSWAGTPETELHSPSSSCDTGRSSGEDSNAPVKTPVTKRKRKDGRNLTTAKLWEWLLHLLTSREKYGHIIEWSDKSKGEFLIKDSMQLENLYNCYKNFARNTERQIKLGSITRALRHYYDDGIIDKVNKKYKYKFGKQALNWEKGVTRENAIKSINSWEMQASSHGQI